SKLVKMLLLRFKILEIQNNVYRIFKELLLKMNVKISYLKREEGLQKIQQSLMNNLRLNLVQLFNNNNLCPISQLKEGKEEANNLQSSSSLKNKQIV